ncbi:MAG: hypothetical protein J6P57_02040, partial [Lachnospiraceae bacterium]|nr:hypothetical protein [Lachnospiraceae bacterium]
YLLNDPYMVKLQQTEKGVPVSKKAVEILNEDGLSATNEYKAIEEIKEYQEELQLIIPNIENESIIDTFKSGADEYIFDKATAGECADTICDEINDIINGKE